MMGVITIELRSIKVVAVATSVFRRLRQFPTATNRSLNFALKREFQTTARLRMAAATSSKKIVTFPSANAAGDARGTLIASTHGGDSSTRGLIVIHEWWGMNEQIQAEGAEIAAEGKLTVLVPDFYRGKVATDREEAGHLMNGLDWSGAVKDISAGAEYLKSLGCKKVGVTGFCMGGALSLAAAALCPEVNAAAPFYGIPGKDLADLTKIRVPVQGHFGELDDIAGFSSPADYNALRDRLVAASVSFELFTYPAGHGFTNPNNPNYNKDACKLALNRVYEFMAKNLA